MRTLGNIIWIVFGGLEMAFGWALAGLLWSITIVGIPIGMQCFKIAGLVLWPFKKEVIYEQNDSLSFLMNILWFFLSGLWLAIAQLIVGVLLCCTIIGIPFGLQHFKFARLGMMPFGARVISMY